MKVHPRSVSLAKGSWSPLTMTSLGIKTWAMLPPIRRPSSNLFPSSSEISSLVRCFKCGHSWIVMAFGISHLLLGILLWLIQCGNARYFCCRYPRTKRSVAAILLLWVPAVFVNVLMFIFCGYVTAFSLFSVSLVINVWLDPESSSAYTKTSWWGSALVDIYTGIVHDSICDGLFLLSTQLCAIAGFSSLMIWLLLWFVFRWFDWLWSDALFLSVFRLDLCSWNIVRCCFSQFFLLHFAGCLHAFIVWKGLAHEKHKLFFLNNSSISACVCWPSLKHSPVPWLSIWQCRHGYLTGLGWFSLLIFSVTLLLSVDKKAWALCSVAGLRLLCLLFASVCDLLEFARFASAWLRLLVAMLASWFRNLQKSCSFGKLWVFDSICVAFLTHLLPTERGNFSRILMFSRLSLRKCSSGTVCIADLQESRKSARSWRASPSYSFMDGHVSNLDRYASEITYGCPNLLSSFLLASLKASSVPIWKYSETASFALPPRYCCK